MLIPLIWLKFMCNNYYGTHIQGETCIFKMDIKAGCNAFGQNFWILLASMQSSGLFLFFLFASSN